MGRYGIALLAMLIPALAAPAVGRDRAPRAQKPQAPKSGGPLAEKPITAAPEREEKPRAGWNGFYGGLNAGGASGAHE